MPISQNLMKSIKNIAPISELYQISEQHSFKTYFMYKTLQNMQPSHSWTWNLENGKMNLWHMNVYWEYTFLFSSLYIYYLSYIYHYPSICSYIYLLLMLNKFRCDFQQMQEQYEYHCVAPSVGCLCYSHGLSSQDI